VSLCGDDRFEAVYRIAGDETEARARSLGICVEQTVEFPLDLVEDGPIRTHVVGRLEALRPVAPAGCEATISYAVETAGAELPQLLNVLFGNSSLQPGIRLERITLPQCLLQHFRGPRFGSQGLRALTDAGRRALLCTALKPMGRSPEALAALAYQLALGGVDLIKDDHGLADQPFAPYRERVARCAEAVARANRDTGGRSLYLPNVSGPADRVLEQAYFARTAGAGGLLVAPGLVGFDVMRRLAEDDALALPILCHPALLGSFVVHPDAGIAHYALFGQLVRLAGADASIFPNYGGRFAFAREDCLSIAAGCRVPMGHLHPSLPAPGGGMSLGRIPDMVATYGADVVLLIGGDLHRHGADLTATARRFREQLERLAAPQSG
jgi:ribulose-bisphosphate carboxylase large chain